MKTNRVNIRLNDDEKKIMDKKSANYPSKSALIRDAVKYFDDRGGANKITSLNNWGKDFMEFKADINRVGNNINQIAHYLNVLKLQDVEVNESILELVKEQIDEWNKMYAEMVKLQDTYVKNVIKI